MDLKFNIIRLSFFATKTQRLKEIQEAQLKASCLSGECISYLNPVCFCEQACTMLSRIPRHSSEVR